MHVEKGESVHQHVLACPVPYLGKRVEIRAHRTPRQHDTLRRPRCARRIDDQGGGLCIGLFRQIRMSSVLLYWQSLESRKRGGKLGGRRGDNQTGRASLMMCRSSDSPAFGFSGTAATPAARRPNRPTQVSVWGVAQRATLSAPATARRPEPLRCEAARS